MKNLLLICLALAVTGCQAKEEPKTIAQLEAELRVAKESGGFKSITLPIVCIHGVQYYASHIYAGNQAFTPAFRKDGVRAMTCSVTPTDSEADE